MAGFSLRRLRRISRPYAAFLASVALLLAPLTALAGPTGAHVIHGNVVFSQNGNIFIIHASNKAIINYSSFNIGPNETVKFIQPHELARVLNRITGPGPTQIDGKLLSNGIVYLVNPAGVMFGPNSVVDVGGIYAAAANISNDRFLRGVDRFKFANGSVVNEGNMKGDFVHLIGQHVANHGVIVANEGIVTMLAGQDVLIGEQRGRMHVRIDGKTITNENYQPEAGTSNPNLQATPGVENTGQIVANKGEVVVGAGDLYSLAIRNTGSIQAQRGNITIAARDGAIHNTGLITAGVDQGQAGTVTVRGPSVVNAGEISADAHQGRAGYVEVTSHDHTYLLDGSTVSAAGGTGRAHGGEVLIHSYEGNTVFSRGALVDVSGGKFGGHGGFAEVSGKSLGFAGMVNLKAKSGYQKGHLLIDPLDIFIVDYAGSGDAYLSPADGDIFFADDTGIPMTISDEALEAILGNITLQADRDIFVEAIVDLVNNNNVWFQAGRNIVFNAPINGANNFSMQADSDNNGIGRLALNVPLSFTGFGKFSGAEIHLGADISGANLLFNGPVLLTSDVNVTGDHITFFNTVDSLGSARALVVNSNGNGITTFAGNVGSTFQLFSLTTNSDGTTAVAGNVLTKSGIDFNDNVLLVGLADQILNAGIGSLHAKSLTKAVSDLDLFGDSITIDNDVTATLGSLVFHADATVGGNVFADDNITFQGNLTLSNSAAQSVTADTGTLLAQGTVEKAQGDLSLTGGTAVNLDHGVNVELGSLDVTGALTSLDTVSAGTSITFNDNADITGDVIADNGFAEFGGVTTVSGNVSAQADIDFTDAASTASIGGSVESDTGKINFAGGADVNGNVNAFAGSITFNGSTDIAGNVVGGLNIDFNDATTTALVGGNVESFGGSISFQGGADIGGFVSGQQNILFNHATALAEVIGAVTSQTGSVTFNGGVDVGGNVEAGTDIFFNNAGQTALVGGNVDADGSVLFNGNADVNGDVLAGLNITFEQNALIGGDVDANAGFVHFKKAGDVTGYVEAGTFITFEDATTTALVGGHVEAFGGDVIFNGGADIGSFVRASQNVSFNNAALAAIIDEFVTAINGSIIFNGDAIVAGDVTADDNITFNQLATIGDLINGTGTVHAINGFVDFNGVTTVGNTVISGTNITFDHNSSVATVGGSVDANGDVTFAGGADVGGYVDSESGSVTFNGQTTVDGFVEAQFDINFAHAVSTAIIGQHVQSFGGDVIFAGGADVGGFVSANQNVEFNNTTLDADVNGDVTAVNGHAIFEGNVTIAGTVHAKTNVEFNNALATALITGNVIADTGDVLFEGVADVSGNVDAVLGNVTFNGQTNVDGFVEAQLDINFAHAVSTAIVGQHVQSFGGNVIFTGGADVGSFVSANQNVEFNNTTLAADVNGSVTATNGHAIFAGNANVNGTVHAGTDVEFTNALATALITGSVITDLGDVLFQGVADVDGNVTAGSNVTFNHANSVAFIGGDVDANDGDVTFAGGATVGGNVIASNNVAFNSNTLAANIGGNVDAEGGSATFNGETNVAGFVEAQLDINFAHAISTAVIGQHVQSFGGNVIFAGGADVGSFVSANQNIEFNNITLAADVNGNVTATNGHAIFAGNATVDGTVFAKTDVSFTNALATALVTGDVIADTGSVLFESVANVTGDVTAENHITFDNLSTVGGDVDAATGNVLFALDTNLGGDVEAGGNITFNSAAVFNGSTSQTVHAGGFLIANSTLTKTAAGTLTLGADAGILANGAITNNFGALIVEDDMVFGGGTITTSGNQDFEGALLLTNNTTLNAGGSEIAFDDHINSVANLGFNLTLNAGEVTFGDSASDQVGTALGGALGTLTVNAQAILNAGAISTKLHQLFNQSLQVNSAATLTSLNGGNVHFFGAITNSTAIAGGGLGELTINTAGDTIFDGPVNLASLVTDGGGRTIINTGLISTTGNQTYGDQVLLAADSTFEGDTITFNGTLDGLGDAFNLSLTASNIIFNQAVGQTQALGMLHATAGGVTTINTSNITANAILFDNDVNLGTSTKLHGRDLVKLAGVVDGNGNKLNIRSSLTRIFQNTTDLGTLVIRGGDVEANALTANALIDINVSGSVSADGNLKYAADQIKLRATDFSSEGSMKLTGGAVIDIKADSIDSSGTIDFDADLLVLNTPHVNADNDVLFNKSGAASVNEFATIVSRDNLTIDAGDEFKMGFQERFTSLESLTINATRATLGDLTTQNDMNVNVGESGTIEILLRGNAGDNTGTDFVSGGDINFTFATLALTRSNNGAPDPVFAPRDGLEGANEDLQILVLDGIRFFELGNGLNLKDGQDLTLTQGNDVLDLDAVGPTSTDLSNALAGVLPEEETGKIVQARANLSSAQRDLLAQFRISIRSWPETTREMTRQIEEESRLTGRYVFEDVSAPTVGSSDRAVAEPRMSRVIADDLLKLREEFWPYDAQTKQYKMEELREMIGRVFDEYSAQAQAAGEELDKVAFREYIDALPQDNPAHAKVLRLRAFMQQLELIGLNSKELARPRNFLIENITPEGLTYEHIETIIAPEVRIGALR